MRVISGSKRGAKLTFVENDFVRPTTDRVKEAVFNIIQFHILGASVLDLFAGSGGLGIEALSRGAQKAVFIDNRKDTFAALKKNLDKTGFTELAECRLTDFELYLRSCKERFGLIFLDPPYHQGLAQRALERIAQAGLLRHDGRSVLECDWDEQIILPSCFEPVKQTRYGRVKITILKIKD